MKGMVKRIEMVDSEQISVARLQRMNLREATGYYGRSFRSLEDLIIDHLMLVRAMPNLDAYEECACRMMVEGYSIEEIAEELGVSPRSARRLVEQLRWTVYGFSPLDAQHRPN
jgi:DNA-binding CsgD family transcriptional regulator